MTTAKERRVDAYLAELHRALDDFEAASVKMRRALDEAKTRIEGDPHV